MTAAVAVRFTLLWLFALAAGTAHAADARRGDVAMIKIQDEGTSTLQVKSPSGALRSSVLLTNNKDIFRNIAVSADGQLVFLTTDRIYSGATTDLWVIRIAGGSAKILSKHVLTPFFKNALAGCSLAGQAAIAVGSPVSGSGGGTRYPVHLGLSCTKGCKTKTDANNYNIYSSTWVLDLTYDTVSKQLARTGATRTSNYSVCKRDVVSQVQALFVPTSPGGKDGRPLMVYGEVDAKTFHFREVAPVAKSLATFRAGSARECVNFHIAGPTEFYSLCPGFGVGYYYNGTLKQTKLVGGKAVTTAVALPPKAKGQPDRFYNYGMATLPGAKQPFFAIYAESNRNGNAKLGVLKFSKSALTKPGTVAFGYGKGQDRAFLIRVVP